MEKLKKTGFQTDGFSLVEILVAITILSLLMVSIYTITNDSTETKDKVIVEDRELLQVQSALTRFATDFSQIFSPRYYSSQYKRSNEEEDEYDTKNSSRFKFTPSEKFPQISSTGHLIPVVESSEEGAIEFFTTSNRRKMQDVKQSRYAWVKYYLRSSSNESEGASSQLEWVREYLPINPYTTEHSWDEGKAQLLLPNIKSLKLSFWHNKRGKFVSSLKLLNDEKFVLRGLKIDLIWIDVNGQENAVTKTFRPLWPFFDTKKDDAEKNKKEKRNENR